ncbi:MAG: ABC transporter permease [Microbacterium sp.]
MTSATTSAPSRTRPRFGGVDALRNLAPVAALAMLFVVLAIVSPSFLSARNLLNVLDQWAPVLILAIGGTIVVVSGALDLSVGGIYSLTTIATVMIANLSGSAFAGIVAGLAAGVLLSLVNGLLSTLAKVTPFVATLATSVVFGGLALFITGGSFQRTTDPALGFARQTFLGAKLTVWIALVVLAVTVFLLTRTSFGRYLYAVGGNVDAARLAGVRVDVVRAAAFAIAGLAAGIAGVLLASRTSAAGASDGSGTAFLVWTAILIGGNSLSGGNAAPWRTVVGVFFLALIGNGFTLMQMPAQLQQVLTGTILAIAVALDALTRHRRR